jgi:hypothetical protein
VSADGAVKGVGGAAKGDGVGGCGATGGAGVGVTGRAVCCGAGVEKGAGAPKGDGGGAANGDANGFGLLSIGDANGSAIGGGAKGSIMVAPNGSGAGVGAVKALDSGALGAKAVITAVVLAVDCGLLASAMVLSIKACESKGFAMWSSTPTLWALASSKGFELPVNNNIGRCAVRESRFKVSQIA